MEEEIKVTDYPERNINEGTTLKLNCYFTTYVRVTGDDKDDWERQIDEFLIDKYEAIEEADKINLDDWEEC